MIGKKGIVESHLHPSGLLQVHGEIWRAEVRGKRPSVDPGETVRIEEVQGLTLIVRPEQEGAEAEPPASRLVKPGEVVVMIGKQVSTASTSLNPRQTAVPRWQQWWQLFF